MLMRGIVGGLAMMAWVLWSASVSAQQLPGGYTCDQVRVMNEAQRKFLIWWHGLTPEDIGKIKKRCGIK